MRTRHADSGRSYVEELIYRLGDAVPARTGGYPATGYGGVTLLRLQSEHLLVPGTTAMTIHDFAGCTI